MKRVIFTLLFFVPLLVSAQLQEPQATMRSSVDSIMLGDTLSLYVDIDKDVAQEISIPNFKDHMMTSAIEIIDGPKLDTISHDNRRILLRLVYTVTSFDAGSYELDSFPVLLGVNEPFDTLFAAGGATLRVGTFEIDTTKDSPEDIKAIIDTPYSWAEFKQWLGDNWYIIVGVLAGVAGIGFALWWWLRRRKRVLLLKNIPPHQAAIENLEKLRNAKLWQNGRMKEYFSTITDILRLYMEQRYGVQALEMTTAEIIVALKELHSEPKIIASLKELFEVADLAKFAKATPDSEQCEMAYFDAYYYVEQTKEVEENQTEEKEK